METGFQDTIEKYPHSDFNKYWDWFEFFLRLEKWEWCFKITWTQEEVEKILSMEEYRKNNKLK